MSDLERDVTNPELVDAAITAGKEEGGLAAFLSLIANEALHDVGVRDTEIERLKVELAAALARALTAELALRTQTARTQRYIDTHRNARHVSSESLMDDAEDDDFLVRRAREAQHVGAAQ